MPILLVEDDRDLADLWSEYLSVRGCPTRVARSVADAIQSIHARAPSLLIVDYTLGDGTASDVIQATESHLHAVGAEVWICSGHGHDLPEALLHKVTGVLAKPFRLDQLYAIVERNASSRST